MDRASSSFVGVGDDDADSVTDDEEQTEGQGQGQCSFERGNAAPSFVDAGRVLFEQGQRQKEQVEQVCKNVQIEIEAIGFDMLCCSELLQCWMTVMLPICHELYVMLRNEYKVKAGEPLNEGIVMRFLLILHLLQSYEITATEYYKYSQGEKKHPYQRLKDPLPQESFMTLWRLLDMPPDPSTERLIRKRFSISDRLRNIVAKGSEWLMKLVLGCKQMDITIDDLMLGAKNTADMVAGGFHTVFNIRKADKNGVSFDVITAAPRLNIVVGFIVGATGDTTRQKEQLIVNSVKGLTTKGTRVHATVDRGFDGAAFALMKAGIDVTSTSRKGRGKRAWIPFSIGPAYFENSDGSTTLPALAMHNTMMAFWVKSRKPNYPDVLHAAIEFRAGKPAVLLKTTNPEMENKFMILPELASDREKLAKEYMVRLSRSTAPSSSSASSATPASTALPGSSSFEQGNSANDGAPVGFALGSDGYETVDAQTSALDAAVHYENFLAQLLNTTMCHLSVTQRTPFWFLARRAISSTTVIHIISWWVKASRRSQYLTGHRRNLEELSVDMVPPEPSSAVSIPYLPRYDEHLEFLRKMAKKDDPSLPSDVVPFASGAIETAAKEDIIRECVLQKLYKIDKRKSVQPPVSDDDVQAMRLNLKGFYDKKFPAVDLAHDVIKGWDGSFKGNESTAKGHEGEEDFVKTLPEELMSAQFSRRLANSSSQPVWTSSLVPTPFFKVSPVTVVGCVAPTMESTCVTSVDGIFAAQDSPGGALEPWIVEVKCKTSFATIKEAREGDGHQLFEINEATCAHELDNLGIALSSPSFGVQVLHHAAATNIPNVVLAILDYELSEVIRFVAVRFSLSLLERHRSTIGFITDRFLPFLTRETMLAWGGMTANHLNFNRRIRQGAIACQMHTRERQVIPLVTYKYNCTKSGVDILHKKMGSIPSPDLGTTRRVCLAFLVAAMYSANQVARAHAVRAKLDRICSAEELSRVLSSVGSDDGITIDVVSEFELSLDSRFAQPKPREPQTQINVAVSLVDPNFKPRDPTWVEAVKAKRDALCNPSIEVSESQKRLRDSLLPLDSSGISPIAFSFFSDPDLISLRLNSDGPAGLLHTWKYSTSKDGATPARLRCVMCCIGCEDGSDKEHSRLGYQTMAKCTCCHANLCTTKRKIWGGDSCFDHWHGRGHHIGSHPYAIPIPSTSTSSNESLTLNAGSNTMQVSLQSTVTVSGAQLKLVPHEILKRQFQATPPGGKPKTRKRNAKSMKLMQPDDERDEEAAATALASLSDVPQNQQSNSGAIKPRKLKFPAAKPRSGKSKKS